MQIYETIQNLTRVSHRNHLRQKRRGFLALYLHKEQRDSAWGQTSIKWQRWLEKSGLLSPGSGLFFFFFFFPKAYESTLSSVNTEQIFGIIFHALLLALYKVAVQ